MARTRQQVAQQATTVTKQELDSLYGGYNDFPPNWTPISEAEFVQSTLFFSYDPERRESRQMLPKEQDGTFSRQHKMVEAILFFYWDGTGVGIERDYYAGKVNYYSFALCEHEYKEIGSVECAKRGIAHWGMHCHVRACAKCGHVFSSDSSG